MRVLVLVGILAGVAGLCQADFCEDLDVIIKSATDGFADVRGELITQHQDALSDTRVVWQCLQVLPGAKTCEVAWTRQEFHYNTYWHKQDAEANLKTFEALAELLSGCAVELKQTSKSGRSHWFVVKDSDNLDITLAHNAKRVRLSFTTAGFPNP